MSTRIDIQRTTHPAARPSGPLGFGLYFTDHMAQLDYEEGKGWSAPRVVARANISLDPAASALQYGQAIFEGMKAFRGADGQVRLFRPREHSARMNQGAARLCMPTFDPELWLELVKAFVRTDADWIPQDPGTALYIRPTMIGTEAYLGVRPSKKFLLYIVASPVGSYWSSGAQAQKIWVEEEHVRAAPGGVGAVKTGGNYAASLQAAEQAKKRGCAQVLWLDAVTRNHIEEIGTMNVFVRTKRALLTPPLHGTLLPGITRDSVVQLAKDWGVIVEERPIGLDEIHKLSEQGELVEMFGSGTAAVITPIAELVSRSGTIRFGEGKMGELSTKLLTTIQGIQSGQLPDPHGWMMPV